VEGKAAASRIVLRVSGRHRQALSWLLSRQPLLLMMRQALESPAVEEECQRPLTQCYCQAVLAGDPGCLPVDQEWLLMVLPFVQH